MADLGLRAAKGLEQRGLHIGQRRRQLRFVDPAFAGHRQRFPAEHAFDQRTQLFDLGGETLEEGVGAAHHGRHDLIPKPGGLIGRRGKGTFGSVEAAFGRGQPSIPKLRKFALRPTKSFLETVEPVLGAVDPGIDMDPEPRQLRVLQVHPPPQTPGRQLEKGLHQTMKAPVLLSGCRRHGTDRHRMRRDRRRSWATRPQPRARPRVRRSPRPPQLPQLRRDFSSASPPPRFGSSPGRTTKTGRVT